VNVQVSTRVDSDIRDAAVRAVEADGLDLSTAIRMFIKRTADLGTLPFSVGVGESLVPNAGLAVAVADAKSGTNMTDAMSIDDAMGHLERL